MDLATGVVVLVFSGFLYGMVAGAVLAALPQFMRGLRGWADDLRQARKRADHDSDYLAGFRAGVRTAAAASIGDERSAQLVADAWQLDETGGDMYRDGGE